jgi:hypothetical protein
MKTEEEWQEHYTKMRSFYEERLKNLELLLDNSMAMNKQLVAIVADKNKAPTRWTPLEDEDILFAYKSVSEKEWAIGGFSDAKLFARIIESKLQKQQ